MNERQSFAYNNPLNDTNVGSIELLNKITYVDSLPGGNQVCIVLAIDR